MRPGPLLVMVAALLAAVHVTGLLFGRPVLRPAEVLATLCLLAYTIRYALLADRARKWDLSVAAALLVVGAALTVPSAPGAGSGLQILSPEEYTGLVRDAWIDSLIPVAVATLFVLVLLVSRRAPIRRGLPLVCGAAGAVLVAGYAVLRYLVIRRSTDDDLLLFGVGDSASGIPVLVAALPPLLLALASLALAVVTAARRQRMAASGGVLLAVAALVWLDSTLGSVGLPYEVRAAGSALSLDHFLATTALPQPAQALTAALRLTAAILLLTGLTRRPPA